MRRHVSQITVEWAHCDAAGIVFYPHFYSWFDQGTERLFKANGLGYPEMKSEFDIGGIPLLETGASYANACKLGDALELTSEVEEWAGKTFLVRHTLSHADGRPALNGFERRVMVVPAPERPAGIRAIEIPRDIIDRFTD